MKDQQNIFMIALLSLRKTFVLILQHQKQNFVWAYIKGLENIPTYLFNKGSLSKILQKVKCNGGNIIKRYYIWFSCWLFFSYVKDIPHTHEYVMKNNFRLVFVARLIFRRPLTSQIFIFMFVFLFNKQCLVRPTLID